MKKLLSFLMCIVIAVSLLSLTGCAEKDEGLKFGMNIHHSGYQAYPEMDLEKNIKACKDLGMDIVRFNKSTADGPALTEIKRVSDLCHKNGMKLMLVVDSTDHYNMPLTVEEIEAKKKEHFYNLSSALGDAVDIYQIFNEIDVHCIHGNKDSLYVQKPDGNNYDAIMWERSLAAVKGALKGIEEGYNNVSSNFAPLTLVNNNIVFEDSEVEKICVSNWDINGNNKL